VPGQLASHPDPVELARPQTGQDAVIKLCSLFMIL
jgi:hypothetical protein